MTLSFGEVDVLNQNEFMLLIAHVRQPKICFYSQDYEFLTTRQSMCSAALFGRISSQERTHAAGWHA
jgi:hypothetical protein